MCVLGRFDSWLGVPGFTEAVCMEARGTHTPKKVSAAGSRGWSTL